MMKISSTEHRSNAEVLEMVGDGRNVLEIIAKRQNNWIRHVLREGGLLRYVMEGRWKKAKWEKEEVDTG